MMDVTVKTLDSQTRQFSVPEQITVKEFKERISGSVNIPASTQRLIFCGRVLQDSKKLSEYEVNGRTIHLVEKPPPSTAASDSGTSSSSSSGHPGSGSREGRDSIFMGAITVQADVPESGNVHVQPNGSHMDVHINLGPINIAPPVSASQQHVNQIRNLMRQVNVTLERLENPTQQQGTQTDPTAAPSSGTPDNSSASTNSSTPSGSSATIQANQQSSTTTGDATPMPETGPHNQRSNQGPNGHPGQRGPTVVHPRGAVMVDILTEMGQVTNRLQPFLDQYRQLLANDRVFEGDSDRQAAICLQRLVNQALHYISHIYHAMSDCMMDLHTSPPRVIRAPAGMMVGPIRPPAQMPVQVNIGPSNQGSATSNASAASSDDQPQSQSSQPSDPSHQTDSNRSASTRTSATSTTQTHAREQTMPMLTNASVTLTNQQTFVITPRPGAPGYVAVPISSSSNQPPPAAGAQPTQAGAQAGNTRPGNQTNQSGSMPRQQGPQVRIHQLGIPAVSIPPAGLLHAISHMVGQQQMQQMAQFPANHAGPTNTSSTPTTSSPRSQQNPQSTPSPQNQQHQTRQAPPPMAFFNPLQPRPAWDPLLPCYSRHIGVSVGPAGLGRTGSSRQNAGTGMDGTVDIGAADTIPGENARAESVPNATGPQPMAADNNLSEMIGGIVGALLNPQQQPFVQVVGPGARTSTQQGTHQGRQQQQQQQPTSTSSSRSSTESSTRGGQPITEQMLMNMMLRMTQEIGTVGMGQRSQSLRQFLDQMGMTLESGDGFIGNLLELVTQQLGISDFVALFLGQPAPLERLRPSLQQFVHERVMQGEPMTTQNIRVAVGRIMTEMEPTVTEFIGDGPTVENIDPVASHMRLFDCILERFLLLFKSPVDESSFAEQMRLLGQNALRQWVALMLRMFGNRENVDRFLSQRLRSWFGGTDSASGNLVASMSLQNFDLAYRTLANTPEQVTQFIVKKQPPATNLDGTPATSGSPVDTRQRTSQLDDDLESDQVIIEAQILVEEPMDTVVAPEQAQVEAVAQVNLNGMESVLPTSAEAAATPIPTTTRAEDGAIGATSRNGWEAAVPAEWVPVINQDISRQRRQAPQSGLSDAYLSSMPPKRMKLTQDQKAPMNNGVETFLPDTLRRAVQATGVQPLTSMQSLLQEAEESTSLHEACEEQIRSAVQERLRRDPDYDPQRFPKTDKYIYKK